MVTIHALHPPKHLACHTYLHCLHCWQAAVAFYTCPRWLRTCLRLRPSPRAPQASSSGSRSRPAAPEQTPQSSLSLPRHQWLPAREVQTCVRSRHNVQITSDATCSRESGVCPWTLNQTGKLKQATDNCRQIKSLISASAS